MYTFFSKKLYPLSLLSLDSLTYNWQLLTKSSLVICNFVLVQQYMSSYKWILLIICTKNINMRIPKIIQKNGWRNKLVDRKIFWVWRQLSHSKRLPVVTLLRHTIIVWIFHISIRHRTKKKTIYRVFYLK